MSYLDRMESIYGSFTRQEGEVLYKYASQCKKGSTVVEIGCLSGRSTSVLGEAQLQNKFKLIVIDPFVDSSPNVARENMQEHFVGNMIGIGCEYKLYPDVAENVVKKIKQKIDLLLVDGDHSTSGVAMDRKCWFPKVKRGGIIVWHDYNSSWLEVKINVDDMVENGELSILEIANSMVITKKL